MSLQPGQLLQARYRVVSLLGQGGMGAVYRAWDIRLEVSVALKEMTPQPGLDAATLTQLRQQFRQEATIVAQLNHPHLVSVTDFFEEGGNAYLVMNFVAGESLSDRIQRSGALPEAQVLAWAAALLNALAYCHSRGVIHRDIKPHNVIIQPDGQPVLVDFGLVKLWNPQEAHTRTAMRGLGTPEYAPPEQYDAGGHTDPRSDLYSLAATLYHALTGQAPPTATQRVINPTLLQPIRRWNSQVSPAVEAVLLRALELQPEARFQSAQEMRAALLSPAASARPPTAPLPPRPTSPLPPASYAPPSPPPSRPAIPPALWIGGGLMLLLLIGLLLAGVVFKAFTALQSVSTTVPPSPPPATWTLAPAPTATATGAVLPESTTPPVTVEAGEPPTPSAPPPTETQPPTFTPRPTLQPPTPTATLTPLPTPTATLTPECPPVSGAFAAIWSTYQSRLGCALNQPHSPVLAQELFQSGQMFWREDTDRVLVLYNSGRWASYADIWHEGDPEFSCPESAPSLSPPTPARGFGKIWCTYPEVRQQLGNATTAERGFYGGLVQDFDRGTLLRTDSGETYILFGDGTWTR